MFVSGATIRRSFAEIPSGPVAFLTLGDVNIFSMTCSITSTNLKVVGRGVREVFWRGVGGALSELKC